MKIKICGLKQPDNIKAVAALSPDFMGFICYGASPRFIADLPADTLSTIPGNMIKTGVFVDESGEVIDQLITKYHFNAIQLHGNESPEFCSLYKEKITVIKAFGVDDNFDFTVLDKYRGVVDYFLFDTKTVIHGGSGKTFDWSLLKNYQLEIPFFLSGGLSLENLEEVIKIDHPQFYGIDLNSRFETEPGIKDIEKIKNALQLFKKTGTHEIRS